MDITENSIGLGRIQGFQFRMGQVGLGHESRPMDNSVSDYALPADDKSVTVIDLAVIFCISILDHQNFIICRKKHLKQKHRRYSITFYVVFVHEYY